MQKDEGSARQQKTKPNEQDITLPDVRPLVRQIVGRFHPKKAWRITAELGERYPVSLQIVFMSPEEFEETKEVVGGLAYPASHWGKILHEENS